MRTRNERGSASIWMVLVIAGAFTVLLGLVVDGGRVIDARVAASRAAAQAARVGADALSSTSVRDGSDSIDVEAAKARAQTYLHDAGMTGHVSVSGQTVTVTVTGSSANQILGVIGISSFPIDETESAEAVTEEDVP
jgi:Flp pilus assembly protein TadG